LEKRLIYNAIETPDGTVIVSRHRHDFVCHKDKNGREYCVDGGLDYIRRQLINYDFDNRMFVTYDHKELSLYDDEPHEVQRKVIAWGTRGKNGDQPLKYVAVKDMETEHIEAVLAECHPAFVIKNCMVNELVYRKSAGK
jgi:hypothetical protein